MIWKMIRDFLSQVGLFLRDKDLKLDEIYAGLGIDDEEFDDEAVLNPLENLTFEELKKKLPPYYFMTPKKKAKYFKKITSDYMSNLKNSNDGEEAKKPTQKVNFQLNNSKTKSKFASSSLP